MVSDSFLEILRAIQDDMRTLFHWFYCLPITDAVLLILLATIIFLLLRDRFKKYQHWKTVIVLLLICELTVILYGTLGQRTEGENLSDPILRPFYSYYVALNGGPKELYRTNFMNAVLFYPAGLLSCELLPRQQKLVWKTVLTTCFFRADEYWY